MTSQAQPRPSLSPRYSVIAAVAGQLRHVIQPSDLTYHGSGSPTVQTQPYDSRASVTQQLAEKPLATNIVDAEATTTLLAEQLQLPSTTHLDQSLPVSLTMNICNNKLVTTLNLHTLRDTILPNSNVVKRSHTTHR